MGAATVHEVVMASSVLPAVIVPIVNGAAMCGPAFTVDTGPGTTCGSIGRSTWPPPLGGLVASAGVSELAPIASMTSAHWRRITGVQLDGTFYCLQAAARNMVAYGRSGSVVFVGSVNGRFGHRGHSAYGAAKAGVKMLARVPRWSSPGPG
jgi:NAD(P)-dependent dehydrogenase (short-subunit alcohol dehydrogenase family)